MASIHTTRTHEDSRNYVKDTLLGGLELTDIPEVIISIIDGEQGRVTINQICPEMVFDYTTRKGMNQTQLLDAMKFLIRKYHYINVPEPYTKWTVEKLMRAAHELRGLDYEFYMRVYQGLETHPHPGQLKDINYMKNILLGGVDSVPDVIVSMIASEQGRVTINQICPEMVFNYTTRAEVNQSQVVDALRFLVRRYHYINVPEPYAKWSIEKLTKAYNELDGWDYEFYLRVYQGFETHPDEMEECVHDYESDDD